MSRLRSVVVNGADSIPYLHRTSDVVSRVAQMSPTARTANDQLELPPVQTQQQTLHTQSQETLAPNLSRPVSATSSSSSCDISSNVKWIPELQTWGAKYNFHYPHLMPKANDKNKNKNSTAGEEEKDCGPTSPDFAASSKVPSLMERLTILPLTAESMSPPTTHMRLADGSSLENVPARPTVAQSRAKFDLIQSDLNKKEAARILDKLQQHENEVTKEKLNPQLRSRPPVGPIRLAPIQTNNLQYDSDSDDDSELMKHRVMRRPRLESEDNISMAASSFTPSLPSSRLSSRPTSSSFSGMRTSASLPHTAASSPIGDCMLRSLALPAFPASPSPVNSDRSPRSAASALLSVTVSPPPEDIESTPMVTIAPIESSPTSSSGNFHIPIPSPLSAEARGAGLLAFNSSPIVETSRLTPVQPATLSDHVEFDSWQSVDSCDPFGHQAHLFNPDGSRKPVLALNMLHRMIGLGVSSHVEGAEEFANLESFHISPSHAGTAQELLQHSKALLESPQNIRMYSRVKTNVSTNSSKNNSARSTPMMRSPATAYRITDEGVPLPQHQ